MRHVPMAYEIEKHHEEIDEVVVLHLRSERNIAILDNPSQGLVQGETVYDAIRAVLRVPEMLVDVGYEKRLADIAESKRKTLLYFRPSRAIRSNTLQHTADDDSSSTSSEYRLMKVCASPITITVGRV